MGAQWGGKEAMKTADGRLSQSQRDGTRRSKEWRETMKSKLFSTLLAVLLVLGLVSATRAEGTCCCPNPEPTYIVKANQSVGGVPAEEGDAEIWVYPTGHIDDHGHLQWAVDCVAAGGTVVAKAGTFFLGDGTTPGGPRVIHLDKGLTLKGETVRDGTGNVTQWLTVMEGGGQGFNVIGVLSSDDNPVIIEGLWMRRFFSGSAILAGASNGLQVRHCKMTDGPALPFSHGIFSYGEQSRGEFVAEDNIIHLALPLPNAIWDSHPIEVLQCNYERISISRNDLTSNDGGIAIVQNGVWEDSSSSTTIHVANNSVALSLSPGTFTFAGIILLNNVHVEAVNVCDNEVEVSGPGGGFLVSGENLTISGNRCYLGEFDGDHPWAAIAVGNPGWYQGFPLGPSLTDSVIRNNQVFGVADAVIAFVDVEGSNHSRGNLAVGNQTASLDAPVTILLAPNVRDNVLRGHSGTVALNGASEDANLITGLTPMAGAGGVGQPPPAELHMPSQ
jgi:hypothetical protein